MLATANLVDVKLTDFSALDCLNGIDAITVKGYEVIHYGEQVHVPYVAPLGINSATKPEGRSFHHGRFVQKLREAAAQATNVTVVEATAQELVRNEWTGQVLGVECTTGNERDYVSISLKRESLCPREALSPSGEVENILDILELTQLLNHPSSTLVT